MSLILYFAYTGWTYYDTMILPHFAINVKTFMHIFGCISNYIIKHQIFREYRPVSAANSTKRLALAHSPSYQADTCANR